MHNPALRASLGLRRLSTKAPNKLDVGALAKKVPLKGQTVLVRADLNLPLSKGDGPPTITDATRLIEALPTLKLLLAEGAKVVCCSHLGRPKGAVLTALSLPPARAELAVYRLSECQLTQVSG